MPSPQLQQEDIPDLLANLVERSLVVFDHQTHRYVMAESTREFAKEKLKEDEDPNVVSQKLAQYLEDFASSLYGNSGRNPADFVREIDNIRASLHWITTAEGHEDDAVQFVNKLVVLGDAVLRTELTPWLHKVLANAKHPAPKAVAVIYRTLAFRALLAHQFDDAEQYIAKGLAIAEPTQDARLIITLLDTDTNLRLSRGNFQEALQLGLQRLQMRKDAGLVISASLNNLSDTARRLEDWKLAQSLQDELTALGPWLNHHLGLANLGFIKYRTGYFEDAKEAFRNSVLISDSVQDETCFALALLGYAGALIEESDFKRAGEIFGFGMELLDAAGQKLEFSDQRDVDMIIARGNELGGETFAMAVDKGSVLSREEILRIVQTDSTDPLSAKAPPLPRGGGQ